MSGADRSVRLWRGVWGNDVDVLVSDCEAEARTGNGIAKSRSTFLVGDLEGDLLGEDGGQSSAREAFGEAEAKVLVRDEIFVGITRRGRLASGICGMGDTSE